MKRMSVFWKVVAVLSAVATAGAAVYVFLRAKKAGCCCEDVCAFDDDTCGDDEAPEVQPEPATEE